MASNDMNSWDEDPDELLRQRWQQTFADFEVQPRSSLSRRILNQITAGHRRRPILWLTGVGLLLISAGLFYQVRVKERSKLGRSYSMPVRHAAPTGPLSASRIPKPVALSDRFIPQQGPSVIDPQPAAPVAHQQSGGQSITSGAEIIAGHRVMMGQLVTGRTTLRSGAGATVGIASVPAGRVRSRTARSVGTRFPLPQAGSAGIVDREPVFTPVGRSVSNSRPFAVDSWAVDQIPVSAWPIGWSRLKPLGITPLPSQLNALPGQLPAADLGDTRSGEAVVVRPSRRWFVDAVPLSSFQWMSAPPASTTYLSQVDAPAAFSPATWGYQINGGIRFQHWQAYLSLGQLRRWAYYTVNENRYRVEPSPTNPNQLVRETYAVAENVSLPMVGAGLSQERLLAQGRYAVELGGQVSYLPTSSQALIGLRGGAGRRLAISRLMELQVGLTVEYGLNRLLNQQHQLAIHPVVVGIGLRIQPRSGHQ